MIKEKTMNEIIVQWIPEDINWGYGKAMRVLKSNHPRFVVGSRFDYGFMGIASEEGFTITVLPMEYK